MDNKIKLFAMASVITVFATGCTGYDNQGANSGNGYSSSSDTGYGSSQNAGSGQVAKNGNTCVPCAKKPTYTYKPKPKPKPRVTYRANTNNQASKHKQQYYIDRWNRSQNQTRVKVAPAKKAKTNYSGYGSGYYKPNTASSTTYYDYSSAGKQKTQNHTASNKAIYTGNYSASNKSIYTGSYQKRTYKPYKPTTYAGGGNSTVKRTTNNYSVASSSSRSSGGNNYTVKKGDTVFEIMRQTGVYWKDIIRLNNLTAPYNISPGQNIRLK